MFARTLPKGSASAKQDRDENIRRIGFVCELLNKHGVVAIAAAISPYRAVRDEIRSKINNFIEVYVDTPLEYCIQRDVKGMYHKTLAGEIKNLTGVSDPYEPPLYPEIVIERQKEPPAVSAGRILANLKHRGLVDPAYESVHTPDEAKTIRVRLMSLGYIES